MIQTIYVIVYILFKLWLGYCIICVAAGGIFGIIGLYSQLSLHDKYKDDTLLETTINYIRGIASYVFIVLFFAHIIPWSFFLFVVNTFILRR
jgi:membrane associated rhomboid family serine protease